MINQNNRKKNNPSFECNEYLTFGSGRICVQRGKSRNIFYITFFLPTPDQKSEISLETFSHLLKNLLYVNIKQQNIKFHKRHGDNYEFFSNIGYPYPFFSFTLLNMGIHFHQKKSITVFLVLFVPIWRRHTFLSYTKLIIFDYIWRL